MGTASAKSKLQNWPQHGTQPRGTTTCMDAQWMKLESDGHMEERQSVRDIGLQPVESGTSTELMNW